MGMKGRREKSQQTNKSLSVSGVMGWTKGGGREAHQAVVDLAVGWLALTPDTLVGSRRGGRTSSAHRVDGLSE